MPLRDFLPQCEIVLDAPAADARQAVRTAIDALAEAGKLDANAHAALSSGLDTATPAIHNLGNGAGVIRLGTAAGVPKASTLLRTREPISIGRAGSIRFLWVLLGPQAHLDPAEEDLESFANLLDDPACARAALSANTREELRAIYIHHQSLVHPEGMAHASQFGLRRTGRLFGGMVIDIRRSLHHYKSDFTDGLNAKVIAAVFFLYFACFAPAVAFGGLLSVLTKGEIGAVEMILATAICGITYALFAGQPLTILGSTGPVIIFMGILYELCVRFQIPFLPSAAWVGLWTTAILIILAATDASALIRHFTRFTDETFAALISFIFIVEALKDSFKGFGNNAIAHDTALLSLLLAFGTYIVASQLNAFGRGPYLRRKVREFLADFGPTIAIVAMTLVAFGLHPVALDTLAVPDTFTTTSGRSWFVNPLEAPVWVWFAAAVPAFLVSVLLFLDQNITVRLVNSRDHRLHKGGGYHLDLFLVGILTGVCSLLGLPWMVAATVRSLNHVRALATSETHHGKDVIVKVCENRVSALSVHVLIALSLGILVYLKTIPMSVLFGLFLYMGVASMRNNQFFERVRLWFMDPDRYPSTHFLRKVPATIVHKFTAVQAACLALLWAVKVSAAGILFPLFIAILVPIRFGLEKFFSREHLAALDAEELPEEEAGRSLE